MPVSLENSEVVYDALKGCGVRLMSSLPETWLVHLIRMADEDPEMIMVRLAKEEEGVGISAGAHFVGVPSAMLWVGAVEPAKFASGAPLPSLHSSQFAPDRERTLRMGVTTLVVSALELLGKP